MVLNASLLGQQQRLRLSDIAILCILRYQTGFSNLTYNYCLVLSLQLLKSHQPSVIRFWKTQLISSINHSKSEALHIPTTPLTRPVMKRIINEAFLRSFGEKLATRSSKWYNTRQVSVSSTSAGTFYSYKLLDEAMLVVEKADYSDVRARVHALSLMTFDWYVVQVYLYAVSGEERGCSVCSWIQFL